MTTDDAVKRELSQSRQPLQSTTDQGNSPSIETEAGEDTEREKRGRSERWKVEGALHDNHYVLISYVWVWGFQRLTDVKSL